MSDDVAREYRAFYDAGFRNTGANDVEWEGNALTTEQKAKAWKDGAAAAAASIEKGKKSGFANYGKKGAVIDSPEALDLKRGDSKTYKNLQSFAQSWGVNIQIGDYGDAVNGSIRDGVIRLNARKFKGAGKTQVIARILAHEVTHRMQETAGEAYAKYRSYALETNARKNGGSLDGIIEAYQQKYADAGEALTREEAMDEIAADYTQMFLQDTQLFKEFISESKEHRSIGRKLIDACKAVVAKIKSAFGSQAARDAASQAQFGEDLNRVEEALRLWEQAYAEGQKAVKKAPVRESTGDGKLKMSASSTVTNIANGAQGKNSKNYDYSKSFSQQIDDYKNGLIPKDDTLIIGATPDVFKSIGFNPLPMTINTTHVDYALNGTKDIDHYLGESLLKQLPDRIKNPVAVFVSQTQRNTSVVALLPFSVNGKHAVLPIVIDGVGKQNNIRIDSNAATSVFGKTNAISKLLLDAVSDEISGKFSMLYWNKKEAILLLQRTGLQLPGSLIPRDGFIHSIREKNSPVKPKFENVTESQQFKRWFGDWKNHPKSASKIVNADGTPKVMYHGSPAQFSVFDKRKAKSSGLYGKRFYFTDSSSHASTYGQLYEVYLNIRNPLEPGKSNVTQNQVRAFLDAVAENEDYSIENYGTYDVDTILGNILGGKTEIDTFQVMQDINATAIGDLVEAVELFNEVNGTSFDGIVVPTETVAFYPEQIKSATDNIGTFDGSNPDIRYSISGTEDILFEFEKQSAAEQDRRYAEAARRVDLRAASQMVDSKAKSWGAITDDTGAPKTFYHGTSNGGFTEFDAYGHGRFGLFGIGSYFTENLSVAESYTKKGKGANPQVYSVFLKANNLIDMDADADIRQWQNAVKDASDYFSGCKTNEDCFKAIKEYCEDEMMVRWEAEEFITDVVQGMGYDGITHIGGGRFNKNDGTRHRVVIVFEPEQIRSASTKTYDNSGNLIPLSERFSDNPDYRYSLAGTEDLIDEVTRKYMKEAREKYGTIEPGENPAREVKLPKKSAPGQKVSQTIRTALEAGVTPDVLVPKIAEGVISGQYSDEVHTNKATLAKAKAWIDGYAVADVALDEWKSKAAEGRLLNENDTVGIVQRRVLVLSVQVFYSGNIGETAENSV